MEVGTWYDCFEVADFISSLIIPSFKSKKLITSYNKLDSLSDGIYNVEMKTSAESHAFVIILDNENIQILNGYGGYYGNPYSVIMLKNEWFNDFNNIKMQTNIHDQLHIINRLFGIGIDHLENSHGHMINDDNNDLIEIENILIKILI